VDRREACTGGDDATVVQIERRLAPGFEAVSESRQDPECRAEIVHDGRKERVEIECRKDRPGVRA